MSRDNKWASNNKDKLLVENFRKFMEEGDFSSEPTNETENETEGDKFFDGVNPPNWSVGRSPDARRALKEVFKNIKKELLEINDGLWRLSRIILSKRLKPEDQKERLTNTSKEILDKMDLFFSDFFSDFEESRLKFLHYKNHGLEEKQAKRLSKFFNQGVDIKNGVKKIANAEEVPDPDQLAMAQADQEAFLKAARMKIQNFNKHMQHRIDGL